MCEMVQRHSCKDVRDGCTNYDITPTAGNVFLVSIKNVRLNQKINEQPMTTKVDENSIQKNNERIWNSSKTTDLKLRIAIEAHCAILGNKAYDATLEAIQRTYSWQKVREDI